MQKKGELSRLAVNLLIGCLIIILGVVIFFIVRGWDEGSQEIFTYENIDLKISQVKTVDDNTLDLNLKRGIGEGEFVGLSFVVSDGSLPDVTFGHLAQGSDLIDRGVVIPGYHCTTSGSHPGDDCVEWYGSAPDLGPFESNY